MLRTDWLLFLASLCDDHTHGVGRARGSFLDTVDANHLVPGLHPSTLLADVHRAEDNRIRPDHGADNLQDSNEIRTQILQGLSSHLQKPFYCTFGSLLYFIQ